MRVLRKGVKHLSSYPVVNFLQLTLEIVPSIFRKTLRGFLLVVDDLGATRPLGVAQFVALRLQLLLQAIDLVRHGLDLGALGVVLLLKICEVALEFVCLADCRLKSDDSDLGRTCRCHGCGRCLRGGAQNS